MSLQAYVKYPAALIMKRSKEHKYTIEKTLLLQSWSKLVQADFS